MAKIQCYNSLLILKEENWTQCAIFAKSLICTKIVGKNEKLTYIPKHEDIFNEEIHEQVYVAEIMMENIKIKKKIEENL